MSIFERSSISETTRQTYTAAMLIYRDEAMERGVVDAWSKINPVGCLMLGKEVLKMGGDLEGRTNDSVWWVLARQPIYGAGNYMTRPGMDADKAEARVAAAMAANELPFTAVPLGKDFGDFRKALDLKLKAWDLDNPVKDRNKKRWRNGLIAAAIVIATVVLTIVTWGVAGGPAVAAAASILTGLGVGAPTAAVLATAAVVGSSVGSTYKTTATYLKNNATANDIATLLTSQQSQAEGWSTQHIVDLSENVAVENGQAPEVAESHALADQKAVTMNVDATAPYLTAGAGTAGGVLGFALGGPLGAVIGAVLGGGATYLTTKNSS